MNYSQNQLSPFAANNSSPIAVRIDDDVSMTENYYIVEVVGKLFVQDGHDRINSQIMLEKTVEYYVPANMKLDSWKVLEEEHFNRTHFYESGYNKIFIERVENDSGEYYYRKHLEGSDNLFATIDYETVDGNDWVKEKFAKYMIVKCDKKSYGSYMNIGAEKCSDYKVPMTFKNNP